MCTLNPDSVFYVFSFDLSDKDNFFDSKTRSSIVSIPMKKWVIVTLKKIHHLFVLEADMYLYF